MSNLILESNVPDAPFTHRGITFMLAGVPNLQEYSMRKVELTAQRFGEPDELSKQSKADKNKVEAYAMIGTIVTGFGVKTVVNGIELDFDAPSDVAEFQTIGEELLGMNEELRLAVWSAGAQRLNDIPAYANVGEIAGNSSTPSASTGALATSPDVQV